MIIEAKKENFKDALGHCIAQMVAAQKYNSINDESISIIYGSVTNENLWSFLKLEEDIVTVDFTEYSILPVERLLGILVWMIEDISK